MTVKPISDADLARVREWKCDDPDCHNAHSHFTLQAMHAVIARLDIAEADNKELRAALNQTSHYLVLSENGWGIEHLVSCRLSGLTNCEIHLLADNNSEMFQEWTYGRYEISLGQDGELIIEEAENG